MENETIPVQTKKPFPLRAILTIIGLGLIGLLAWLFWPAPKQNAVAPVETAAKAAEAANEGPRSMIELSAQAMTRADIKTTAVELGQISDELSVAGRLALNEDEVVLVGTIVTGRVTRVLAMVGDQVKEKQSLIYIHSHELVDARAAEAKARVAVTDREKALAYAKAELERAERLLEAKAVSKREHALALANVNVANAELEQARAELTRASEFLEHLSVPHDSHEDIVVFSPISGIVIKRNVSVGTVVSEAMDLMKVANLSTLWAIAQVPEKQAAVVRTGQSVSVELPAFNNARFPGRIVHIGDSLDPETRTVQVRCLIQNPRRNLRPEMFATVHISNGATTPAITVPRDSVFEIDKDKVVFLAAGEGKFEKRKVETGREQGGRLEILSGLKPGDKIVTHGGFFIKSEFLKGSMAEE
jgi:cobalt-zinc-cadmium efflux system membrane fusion protein